LGHHVVREVDRKADQRHRRTNGPDRSVSAGLPRDGGTDRRALRAHRLIEERLDAILGAIGDAIVIVEEDDRIGMANRAAQRLIGPIGERTASGLLERFEPPGLTIDGLAAASPRSVREADGDRRWFEVSAYPVHEHGETILIVRDVTAARQRDAIRDSFIGVLSHELRTPLTTIYGGAQVLARAPAALDERARADIVEDIRDEADRLHRLVEDVVALTRFGEGELEVGRDPVLVQRVVPAVLGAEASRWPAQQIEVAIEPDLPPVAGDMTYVEQVLRNLLANARKYGGPSGWVRVEAEADADGDEVLVRVLDEGPGLVEAEARRLFDLYYRSPTVAREVSGSGIGLFVCDRLVAAMGGHVWALNRPTGGAEFGFGLRIFASDTEQYA
jgi:signal transduction histidine kinase